MKCILIIALLGLTACEAAKGTSDYNQPNTDDGPESADDTAASTDDDTGSTAGNDTGPIASTVFIDLPAGAVLDPKLEDSPSLRIETHVDIDVGCTAILKASNGIGQTHQWDLPAEPIEWNGNDADGIGFDPGPVTLDIHVDCGGAIDSMAEATIHIVRLGITSIDFHDPSDSDGNVDLAFHKNSLFDTEVTVIGTRAEYARSSAGALESDLDKDDGHPASSIEPWGHPDISPWASGATSAHNVPTGYVAGSAIRATMTLGEQAVSMVRHIAVPAFGPTPEDVPRIRLVGTADDESDATPGSEISLDLSPARETMGKEMRTLTWSFEAEDSSGDWMAIPGTIDTEHVIYTLAGEPALLDGEPVGSAPPVPWIGVLEETASALDGVAANPADVLDALRDHLHYHGYILYDPGVGAYTEFEGSYMYWDSITADMSSFLDRTSGLRLYCHSMSCLLSALAGNVGVHAEQIVLGVDFTTNQTRAAGGDTWRRWGFNSHSVVTPDDGETIWDASIALDGDDNPYEAPIEEIQPKGMDGDEYFWRLTYDDIEIINQGLCFIQ